MAFTNKPFVWKNNGVTPPETLQNSGFIGGKKLPAPYVNAQWTATYKAIEELQQKAGEVKTVNNALPNAAGNISVTKSTVGLSNVDNTSDVNKPISNATKAELDKKYTKPATGIPKTDLSTDVQASLVKAESALQSVTKADVGLSNVDNTSDASKPISTAQQAALNLKANIASPTFTGTPRSTTATAGTNTAQIATTAFVKTAVDNSATTINDSITAVAQDITTHKADNVSHDTYVSCATTGATAEKVVTVNGFTLVEGARITVNFANANTATTPTLKINTEVAKPLVKADGTAFKNIKAGIYSFVYSGSNFTVQGEGGEYGTATASEVLQGYTLGTENGVVNGVFSSLKSKQSGIVSLSATDTFIDVNISAVNISKSILDVSCSPGNSNETTHATMAVKIEFINTNTIRLTRAKASTSTSTINVSWVVYEFNNVKSLQRGSKTLAATTYNDVSISAVNINKSMIFISYTDTMNATIQSSYITRYFGSSSLITFHCTQPTDKIINWQVIEFY